MIKFKEVGHKEGETARYAVRSKRKLIGYVYCFQVQWAERKYSGDGHTTAGVEILSYNGIGWGCEWLDGNDTGYQLWEPSRKDAAYHLATQQHQHNERTYTTFNTSPPMTVRASTADRATRKVIDQLRTLDIQSPLSGDPLTDYFDTARGCYGIKFTNGETGWATGS